MSHEHDQSDERWSVGYWDERYGGRPALWSGHVNAALATEAAALTPGRALDVGCGEGGDALWLAQQGWEVVGTDISQVALDRAAAAASAAGVADRTSWEQHDLFTWTPPASSYDLVALAFFHLPADRRRRVYAALAAAVAPGGTFLVVAHDFSDHEVVLRPQEPSLFFTADDLAAELSEEWVVHVAESRPREATHPETGETVTVRDAVLRAERTTR